MPGGGPAAFHGPRGGEPDLSPESRSLALHLRGSGEQDDLYLMAHAHWEPQAFALPKLRAGRSWRCFLDTAEPPPRDIAEPGEEAPLAKAASYTVSPRSVVLLVGR